MKIGFRGRFVFVSGELLIRGGSAEDYRSSGLEDSLGNVDLVE